MPGLKIIEIVLGLTFVYLLLSLLCTAINEYISGMLNKRGRELFKAVDDMLESKEVQDAFYSHPLITSLSPSHARIRERVSKTEKWMYGSRWIRRFTMWLRPTIRGQRLPSYLPARNFALALLNSTDYAAEKLGVPDAPLATMGSPPAGSPPTGSPPDDGTLVAVTPRSMVRLFDALLQESAADVSELLRDPAVATLLGSAAVPAQVRQALTDVSTGAELELQKLEDSVEVWFNNAMDRVSGAYKRYTQIALLLIGFVVATLLNADTIRIWQKLATDDKLRESVVQQAIAFNDAANKALQADSTGSDTTRVAPIVSDSNQAAQPANDSTGNAPGGGNTPTGSGAPSSNATQLAATTPQDSSCSPVTGDSVFAAIGKVRDKQHLTCGEAMAVISFSRAQLDSMQLVLGWSSAELLAIGVAKEVPNDTTKRDTTRADSTKSRAGAGATAAAAQDSTNRAAAGTHLRPSVPSNRGEWLAFLVKLVGLILTAIAVSLGAPFWFDMLNKIINIRSAGRAPDERPKNPEARDKRLAGQAPR